MRFFPFVPFLFVAFFSQAQKGQDSAVVPNADQGHKWEVGLSPLALLQPDATLMGGAEYIVKPRLRLVADAGFIFHSIFAGNDNRGRGFIFRPGVKYFYGKSGRGYVQGQAFYKRVVHSLQDWVDKDVVNGIPAYREFQEFNLRRNVVGVNAILGIVTPFFKSKNVFADVYLGFGVRKKFFKAMLSKNDRYDTERFDFFTINGTTNDVLPSLPMGVRLLFVIR